MAGLLSNLFKRKEAPTVSVSRLAEPEQKARSRRANSFLEVTVITAHGYKRQGVAVDVSKTGARLRFHTAERMAGPIRLKIPRLNLDTVADIAWHKGVDVGVRFSN